MDPVVEEDVPHDLESEEKSENVNGPPETHEGITADHEGKALNEDDELEEGELKDDDDDDEDEDENEKVEEEEAAKSRSSSSDDDSPERPQSSSSSTSESCSSPSSTSISKDKSSSKCSSRIGSHASSASRNSASYDRHNKISLFLSREDRCRAAWDRERQDPSEKAAKLISMRTKLLEARSREIELKFQKNRPTLTHSQPLSVLTLTKMTITKPSISYSENPSANLREELSVIEKSSEKSKPQSEDKLKNQKKKSKKKKKKRRPPKKHKKHKNDSVVKDQSVECKHSSEDLRVAHDNQDRQGPRTPPDNNVMTLEDEQVEWPSHLIKMTIALPSISYSVNPRILDSSSGDQSKQIHPKRRENSIVSPEYSKRVKTHASPVPDSSSQISISPHVYKMDENISHRKYSPPKYVVHGPDLNYDYSWYCAYFVKSFEMDHHQAQHQALFAIMTSGTYSQETLEKWLSIRGFTRENVADGSHKQLYPYSLKDTQRSPFGSVDDSSSKSSSLNKTEVSGQDPIDRTIPTVITRVTRNQVNRDVDMSHETETNLSQVNSRHAREVTDTSVKVEDSRGQAPNLEIAIKSGDGHPVIESAIGHEINSRTIKHEKSNDDTVHALPINPMCTTYRLTSEIVLPDGLVLPVGTLQKIVHPYPRLDSEVLNPYYDFY